MSTHVTNPSTEHELGAVAFVDLAGFTALTEAHGDEQAIALIDTFEEMLTRDLPERGRLIKVVGDAGLLVFDDVLWAVTGVLQIVRRTAEVPHFPEVRVGLHHGPIAWRRGDPYGATVNLAARIAGAAAGSQILISGSAASRLSDHVATPVGPRVFRNISARVELFEIPSNASQTHLDPVCQMQVSPALAAATVRHADRLWHLCSMACVQRFSNNPDVYVRQVQRATRAAAVAKSASGLSRIGSPPSPTAWRR